MYRIACLRIPKFQIVVQQKHEPQLKNKEFVLLADAQKPADTVNLSRARVFMCSPAASKKNVVSGMKWTEARATCAGLTWRQCDHKLYQQAKTKVVGELIACSPRVSAKEPGIFILDASGLGRLGGENKLCRDILKLVSRLGYVEGQVGIADSAFAALVATRFKKRWHIVPPGQDAEFLKPLSLNHLALDYDLHDMFIDLGLKSMGDIARLPVDALAERFGDEVAKTQQLVLGFDRLQPEVPAPEKQFSVFIELGGAMDALNETLFVFKSLLDTVTEQLKENAYWAEELQIQFFNDSEMFDDRKLKLVRASSNAKFLLEVVRLSIEAHPLIREYTAIKLAVSRFSKEIYEQSTIQSDSDTKKISLSQQSNLLQKFVTRLGENTLVKPVANDQYTPDKAGIWVPIFKPIKTSPTSRLVALDAAQSAEEAAVPVNCLYVNEKSGAHGLVSGLVLRQTPNPVPILVELNNGAPAAVAYLGQWHYVKEITAPECLSGFWWEDAYRRSYYTALIEPKYNHSSPLLVQLVREHDQQAWFLNGIYD